MAILMIILRLSDPGEDKQRYSVRMFCQQALAYIDSNYRNNIKVQDIARALSVSHSHLTHVFNQEIHLSPFEYIGFLRISEAKQALLFSQQDARHISKAVGYTRYNVFLNNFKLQTGLSPEEYRQKHHLTSYGDFGDHIEIV